MSVKWRDAARMLGKYKIVLPVILLGLLMILWPGMTDKAPEADASYTPFPLREAEQSLETVLSTVAGAGQVKVMLTLKTDMTVVLQEDVKQKEDIRQDGQSNDTLKERDAKTVLIGGSSGQPIVVRRVYPEFRGALVVCEGGGDPQVRLSVTNAVASLTGLGSDKITVTSMKIP